MLRIGFLPSDFNPMVLMLGEAEDLRLLAGVLRQFAREQSDVRLDRLGFCTAPHTALTVTASPGAPCWAESSPSRESSGSRVRNRGRANSVGKS